MYNYSTVLTYRNYDNDDVYRNEILKCFNIDEYNDELTKHILELYEKHKNEYIEILRELKKNNRYAVFDLLDEKYLFITLFSWESWFENHSYLKSLELNKEKTITKKNLINKIIENRI